MQNTLIYLCMSASSQTRLHTNKYKQNEKCSICLRQEADSSKRSKYWTKYILAYYNATCKKSEKNKKNIVFSQDNSGDTHPFQMAQRRSISPLACHAHFLQRHYFHKNKKRVNKSNKKKECTLKKRKLSWRHTSTILLSCRSVLRFSFSSILE